MIRSFLCQSLHRERDSLLQQILGSVVDVVGSESRDEEVAVVVIRLQPQVDVLITACFLCRLDKVLRKQLSLLVEVVSSTLN